MNEEPESYIAPGRETRVGIRIRSHLEEESPLSSSYELSPCTSTFGTNKDVIRRRSQPFTEKEMRRLIALYCANRKRFHGKFPSGRRVKEEFLEKWSEEISSMAIAVRTKSQIEEKLRNEVKRVQKYLKAEKERMNWVGSGRVPVPVKALPSYLEPLLRELSDPQTESIRRLEQDECYEDFDQDSMIEYDASEVERRLAINQPSEVSSPTSKASTPRTSQERGSMKRAEPEFEFHEMEDDMSRPKRAYTTKAIESLTAFTDARSTLYQEEIKLARMRQEEVAKTIELRELQIAKTKMEMELLSTRNEPRLD